MPECVVGENMMIDRQGHHSDDVPSLPEKLIDSLEDSQEIKNDEETMVREPLPEIDEFNEFSEPEDMMEDLRKEVEKVVETIDDNECLPESTWNYQVPDEIEGSEAQPHDDLHLYSEALIQNNPESSMSSNYEDNENAEENNDNTEIIDRDDEVRDFESDDEDDKPLEQVRQEIQKGDLQKHQTEDDKEDIELNECLKKIHNFKCNACNKAFNSRTALGYHLKTHTTERRYVCDQVR